MITYKLYISESDNVDTVANAEANGTLKDQGVDVTSLLADNLDFNTQYYYNVIAEDSVGKSIYESNSVTTIEADSPPTEQPTITEVIEGVDQATVDFTEVARAGSYQFRINAGNSSIITEIPFTILNLQPNTSYNVEVRAVNSGGNGPWSDPFSFTTQQVSAPTGTPTLTENSHNLTSITASYATISNVDGYEYRLNGSIVVDIELDNPFTISGLAQNSTNTIEVRGYNNGGDGPWSNLITVTTDSEVVDEPVITNVENTVDPVVVSFDEVDFASGYDYRINGGVVTDIGTTNLFNITVEEGDTYTVEVRGKNQYGNGPWSDVETFIADYTPSTLTNSVIIPSVTDSTYTLEFDSATDNYTLDGQLQYFLVEGTPTQLQDKDLIQQLTPKASGIDQSIFTVNTSNREPINATVYVKDEAGNISIYSYVTVILLDPRIELFDSFVNGADVNSLSGDAYDTFEISWEVVAIDSTNNDVVISSTNENVVALSNIDYTARTATATLQPVEFGGTTSASINIVADLDGTTETISASVSTLEEAENTTSSPITFDVIA